MTPEAIECFHQHGLLFAPGKASNAGGVATSGLEMSQNSLRLNWPREEVDRRLEEIMVNIHRNSSETAKKYGMEGNYVAGANIAGFLKVAESMEPKASSRLRLMTIISASYVQATFIRLRQPETQHVRDDIPWKGKAIMVHR